MIGYGPAMGKGEGLSKRISVSQDNKYRPHKLLTHPPRDTLRVFTWPA